MALGAFLMGMMLSASDYRHQIEASVEPFKGVLIGLFFISVGMSIDLKLLVDEWVEVAKGVTALMSLKVITLLILALILGLGRAVAIRSSFLLCQCGEFGFVLFGAIIQEEDAFRALSAIGMFPILIGAAYMVMWKTTNRGG